MRAPTVAWGIIAWAACTAQRAVGGIVGCNGTRATMDAATPAFANRLLSADEINTNVPETSMTQWRMISACNTYSSDDIYGGLSSINSLSGCANNTIGPGTYLFVQNAGGICGSPEPEYSGFSSFIAIFDHPVSYRSVHAADVFYNFIDIDGPNFTEWDIQVSPTHYCDTAMNTNISDLDMTRGFSLCVYELK